MTVRIVTDSSCDLPAAVADELGIAVVPLSIRFGDTEYIDRRDLTTAEFWAKCASAPELPQTAAPSPGQFAETYAALAAQGAQEIVVLSLSSELSATMQSALNAAAQPGGAGVRVVDSRNASLGLGLIAIECAEAARRGSSADEIVALAGSLVHRTRVHAALDTLENLRKGGRIGGAKALIGTALAVKPLIEVIDGRVEQAGKQRTRGKALAALVDTLAQAGPIARLGVLHAQCPDIDDFVDAVRAVHPGEVMVGDIGAVIGTHAGPGAMGIAFITAG